MKVEPIRDPDLKKTYLGAYQQRDEHHPVKVTFYNYIEKYNGVTVYRPCTEWMCLAFYILFTIATITLSILCGLKYDTRRLEFGMDFRTDLCDNYQLDGLPYVYWPDPSSWGIAVKMCVDACPLELGNEICLYDEYYLEVEDDYCTDTYETRAVGKYCLPIEMNYYRELIEEEIFYSADGFLITASSDFYVMKEIQLIALGGSVFFAFFYHLLMLCTWKRFNRFFYILFSLIIFMGLTSIMYCAFMDLYEIINLACFSKIEAKGCGGLRSIFAKIIVAFCGYAALFYMIYIIKEFKKIRFALKLVQEMTVPIRKVKMLFFPLFVSILQILFTCIFAYLWFMFMSSGYAHNTPAGEDFSESEVRRVNTKLYAFYGCIALLLCFASYIGFFTTLQRFVICSQVAQWYFSKSKLFLTGTFCKALHASKFHYGTFFYYSFLIMVIWPLRTMAAFIKRRFNRIEYANKFNLFIVKSFKPFLYFYEMRWKYFTSDNIIQMALFGDNFRLAGMRLYYLKYRNFSRAQAFMNIYGYITIQGKLLASSLSAAFVYYYLTFGNVTLLEVNMDLVQMPAIVVMFTFLGSMIISQNYTNLIDLSVQTLVICFIADEEMFTGQQRYAEPLFRKFFDELGQEADRREYQKVTAKKSEYSVGGINTTKRPLRPRNFDDNETVTVRAGDPSAKFDGQNLADLLGDEENPEKKQRPEGEEGNEGERTQQPNLGINAEDEGFNNRFFYNRPPTPPPPPEEKSSYEEVSSSEEEDVAPVNVTKRDRDFFNFSADISHSEIKNPPKPIPEIRINKPAQGWSTAASGPAKRDESKSSNQLGFTTAVPNKKVLDNSRDNLGRFDNNVSQEVSKLDNKKTNPSNKFKGIMDDDDDDDDYSYDV